MATMRDVAERAGVSIATVSFLVNDTKPVAPATRERIEHAMKELGYRRNMVARALASRRTRVLALVYPLERELNFASSAAFFTAAATRASEIGYHLVIWPVGYDGHQLTELVGQGLVDGVVLMEVQLEDPRVDVLQASHTPLAMIGRTLVPDTIPYVDFDFETTVGTALDHLGGLGHRDIALLIGSQDQPDRSRYGAYVRTEEAFWSALEDRGMHGSLIRCEPTIEAGRRVLHQVAAAATTAVLTMNEPPVRGLVFEAARAGVEIPSDLSLVALFSTPLLSQSFDPELTHLVAPASALGRLGVDALVALIEEQPYSSRVVAAELAVRCSSGPAPTPIGS